MDNLERKDIAKIAIEVVKKVRTIASNNLEFNEIMERIEDLVLANEEGLSFSELEKIIKICENLGESINKGAVIDFYAQRILPYERKIKSSSQEDEQMYRVALDTSYAKIHELTKNGVNLSEDNWSAKILDELMPCKEFNFKVIFSEMLGEVQEMVNEKEKGKPENIGPEI